MEDITFTVFIQSIKALITIIINKLYIKIIKILKLYNITMTSVKKIKSK